ncbi:MAG: hypothetical protein NVS9B15_21900 [Acidobacteriaceae bacterium]
MDIHKVAALAKVSIATVSRTINRSPKVREDTAERVWAAVRELNYHPNSLARSLRSGRSRIFGLVTSDIANPFFSDLVKSFELIAGDQQHEVIVTNPNTIQYAPETACTGFSSARSMASHS